MFKLYFTHNWNNFKDAQLCLWNIVQLFMIHQEGHVARASLVIGNFTPPTASYIAIFEDEELLFQGAISGQFEHQHNLTKVDILGITPTFEADLKALLSAQSSSYNPVFFQQSTSKVSDYLESGNDLFYWERTTGKIQLSNYFQGRRCIDISGQYIKKSFKTHQIVMPLGKVIIDLKVHWTQTLEGIFNAAPYIAKAFPEKILSTLTPTAITNSWPIEDQRLGLGQRKSGYRVEQSKIAAMPVSELRAYTKPICTKQNEKGIRAKIHYFNAALKIHWQYNQPRMEQMTIHGQLNHCQHQFTQHRFRRIPITIELPKSQQAIFFETNQGQKFIEYASYIAQSQLKASARCIQVLCTLPWNVGRDLTIDDSLYAKEKFTGKITKVFHVVKGMQRFVEVTVGCVIQSGDLVDNTENTVSDYSLEQWDDSVYSSDSLQGIPCSKLHPKDIIQQIQVKNSAFEQEAYLLQNQYPVRDNIHAVLQEVPTSIHIELRDLRTDKLLVRGFEKKLKVVEVPEIYPSLPN